MRKVIGTWIGNNLPTDILDTLTKMNSFVKGEIVEFGTGYLLIGDKNNETKYNELMKAANKQVKGQ